MMYAKVNAARTEIIKVGPRPDWHIDGEPVSDAVLAAGGLDDVERDGWVPVIRESVEHDSLMQRLIWDDQTEWLIEADRVIQTFTIQDRSIIEIKSEVATMIDNLADGARSNFVTQGGPGQALEYDQTRREIDTWQVATDPDIDDYPMLRAEYRARQIAEPEISVEQVIDDTIAEVGIWFTVGPAIKEIRRTGKVAIDVAETKQRVRDVLDWCQTAFRSAAMTGAFEKLPAH